MNLIYLIIQQLISSIVTCLPVKGKGPLEQYGVGELSDIDGVTKEQDQYFQRARNPALQFNQMFGDYFFNSQYGQSADDSAFDFDIGLFDSESDESNGVSQQISRRQRSRISDKNDLVEGFGENDLSQRLALQDDDESRYETPRTELSSDNEDDYRTPVQSTQPSTFFQQVRDRLNGIMNHMNSYQDIGIESPQMSGQSIDSRESHTNGVSDPRVYSKFLGKRPHENSQLMDAHLNQEAQSQYKRVRRYKLRTEMDDEPEVQSRSQEDYAQQEFGKLSLDSKNDKNI